MFIEELGMKGDNVDVIMKILAVLLLGIGLGTIFTMLSWGSLALIAEDGLERGYIIHHPNSGELIWNPDLKLEK